MDIISSINSAFTQVQRFQHMSVSSGENNRSAGYRERETVSNTNGPMQGGGGFLTGGGAVPALDGVASAVQNAIAYDRAEKGTVQLRTQEGDVVRLKFLNAESFNAENQQFEEGGSVISDFSMSGFNSSQFKVVVDGDLNGEELTAIREVLVQAREMADMFYSGEVKEAFSMASDLNFDSDQLANVNMNLSLRETFTYENTSMSAPVPSPVVTPGPGEQTQPISPVVDAAPPSAPATDPSTPTSVTPQVAQPDTEAVAPVASEPVAATVPPDTPSVPETQVHAAPDPAGVASALSTINNFLSQLTESLNAFSNQFASPSSSSQSPFNFTGGFQLQMVSALVSQIESPAVEQPSAGHALAAATINAVAVRMDAHVDDVA